MIESNILGTAAGIQYQGVIDKSEGTSLPSLSNGVIIGRFKRGYTGKVFTVTADSYKTVLGHDPSNPSYMAVADLFSRGVSEVSVLRVVQTGSAINTEWVVNNIAEGSSCGKTLVQASRTKDNIEVFSDIEVTPTVQQVSNEIIAGNYGTEVNNAVLAIDPEATNWVMDVENNRIKYIVAGSGGVGYTTRWNGVKYKGETQAEVALKACSATGGTLEGTPDTSSSGFYKHFCQPASGWGDSVTVTVDPDYVPEPPQEKYIPIDTIAAQIISNAEACNITSENRLFNIVTSLAHSGFYNDLFEANIL